MSADDDICAACGKGGEGEGLKTCNSCKGAKYCNADCQRAHWVRHKRDCKQRAAELRDEALFKDHVHEECPLCLLPFPVDVRDTSYMPCCGKTICYGCVYGVLRSKAQERSSLGKKNSNLSMDVLFGNCPFCRTPHESSEDEKVRRLEKRMELNDPGAFFAMGSRFYDPKAVTVGMAVDYDRAFDLWSKAAALGSAAANHNIGVWYAEGVVVPKNEKKAKHHLEIAAMGGYPS